MAHQHIFSLLVSQADRKSVSLAGIVAVASLSLGTIMALLLDFPLVLSIGVAVGIFFLVLFLKDPFLFLLLIIPFRMMLDFSGEFFTISLSDTLSVSLSQAMGLFIFAIVLLFVVRARNIQSAVRGLFPFWVFFGWAVFSLVVSVAPWETVRDLVRVFDIFALASLAFLETKSPSRFKRVLAATLFSAIIPIAFGMFQYVTGSWYPNEFVDLERIYGTFGHPNIFGLFLFASMVASFLFSRFLAETRNERIFSASIGAISCLLLFVTLARVAWVAAFFFFLSVAFFKFRQWFIPILAVSILLFFTVPAVEDRIVEALTPSADSSVLWRINIWTDGLSRTFVEGRELFGFGLNTFSVVVSDLHSEEFGSSEAHNDFVKFFTEGGFVGLFVYLFWMGWFIFRLFRMSRDTERGSPSKEIAFFLFLFLVSLLLASLSDAVFKSTPIQWILWILIGSFLGIEYSKKETSFIRKI